jgi:hypothetical protein
VLLGVVADLQPVPRLDRPGVRGVQAGKDPQQGRLAGAVEPEHHDLAAPVDGQVHVGEDLERAIAAGQPTRPQRGLPARRRVREAQLGHLVMRPLALDAGEEPFRPAGHVLGGGRLRGLGPHLVGLRHQRRGLLLGIGALPLAALLVGLTLLQVGLPADVVLVQLRAVRIQVVDLVDHLIEERHVVADDEEPALVDLQMVPEPRDRVGVQVVRGLVEQQGRRPRKQDPGQLDAAPLPAGEGLQLLPEHPILQAEGGSDGGGLGLGGVPARGVEARLQLGVARHRPLVRVRIGAGHGALRLVHGPDDLVEAPRGQDPVPGQDVHVPVAWVLWQVAHVAGARHAPGRRRVPAGEHLRQGGLARAVAADQPDPVAGAHPEGRLAEQEPTAGAQLDAGGRDHAVLLSSRCGRRPSQGAAALRRTGGGAPW